MLRSAAVAGRSLDGIWYANGRFLQGAI